MKRINLLLSVLGIMALARRALGAVLLIAFSVAIRQAPVQDDESWEKIRDTSPDKKFGMRIKCESEPADPEHIDSTLIKAIELVSLPSKKVVAKLLPSDDVGTTFEDVTLIWSSDSKWCAFYFRSPRIAYTTVFRRVGNKFVAANKREKPMIHLQGFVKSEYVQPGRWLQPGVLVLKQLTIFHENDAEASYEFTARFDPKTGKFQVTSKREVTADEETKE
jgi:hypothetical protein